MTRIACSSPGPDRRAATGSNGRDWLEPATPIHIADLEAAEARQGVRVGQGDVLLVRTGYGRQRREHGQADPWKQGRAGLHAACLPWLQERAIAMLGSDTANDVMPSGYPQLRMPIHIVGMVAMGLWLMDNLDLEDLAATSAELTRREFLFMLAPLRFAGGTGSPVNPLAGVLNRDAPDQHPGLRGLLAMRTVLVSGRIVAVRDIGR